LIASSKLLLHLLQSGAIDVNQMNLRAELDERFGTRGADPACTPCNYYATPFNALKHSHLRIKVEVDKSSSLKHRALHATRANKGPFNGRCQPTLRLETY
jgi:hypothetical protein